MTATRITVVIGTRPEAIKLAPVIRALRATGWAGVTILLTGQHDALLDDALGDFGLKGDANLALMAPGQSLAALAGRALVGLDRAIADSRPDLLIAQGDTMTVMAAALACFYAGVPFGHVEAGLRTGDLQAPFPEEFNRIVAGRLARLHFAPTGRAVQALLAEGVPGERIFLTGNTVIDALAHAAGMADAVRFRPATGRRLILLTAHRRETFGAPLRSLLVRLRHMVARDGTLELLFPVHPNPAVQAAARETLGGHPRIRLVDPLGYLDFVGAMQAADVIVTDSGGVQEEAPFLGKPVIVLRHATERPEAVACGAAHLVGTDPDALEQALGRLLADPGPGHVRPHGISPYGDSHAAGRIVAAIAQYFGRGDAPPFAPFVAPAGSDA